ncbi:DUF2937 family protein [Tropicibacter naphthalenivorans]|uniref:DUF2937 family protein n=1 Tax=Tropicibacter naphthalenivorans TaxID=441103 RepID=A0A0P1G492_9RHOB|nr:DUF2937 family protein [Tropicibacter naphthalenivorans]CUH76564.1 hypothetical protein TRN7648_01001 [Tropicibacter naphthalenivorans]SMC65158.1 Protein of unknown function [Tropicibacter naphthalenivorans]
MILRALTLVAGLAGAGVSSQFPEYSQQYKQRLGGAVDELARQVTRYQGDAEAAGMGLPAYLETLAAEGPLAQTQAQNMAADIARYERLSAALTRLQDAGPFMRAKQAAWMEDPEIAARAWEAFEPAVPVTFEGAVFAGTGFAGGWLTVSAVWAFLSGGWSLLFRRRAA